MHSFCSPDPFLDLRPNPMGSKTSVMENNNASCEDTRILSKS